MPFPEIDPILIEIGPLAIRWYALAYIVSLILGWRYAVRLVRTDRLWDGKPPATPAQIDDLLLWATLGIIVGGRLGYVLFYNPGYYLSEPAAIFAVWQGGMSFHGGMLGVIVAIMLFARRQKLSMLSVADLIGAAVPIGLFFGRIANFINAELWGRTTDVPWGVVFPGAGPVPRHPSQLYEAALEGIVLFLVLRFLTHRAGALNRPGTVTGVFLIGYGLARIFVEFFREPDAHIGFLAGDITMGMILSLPMVLAGLVFVWWAGKQAGAATAGR